MRPTRVQPPPAAMGGVARPRSRSRTSTDPVPRGPKSLRPERKSRLALCRPLGTTPPRPGVGHDHRPHRCRCPPEQPQRPPQIGESETPSPPPGERRPFTQEGGWRHDLPRDQAGLPSSAFRSQSQSMPTARAAGSRCRNAISRETCGNRSSLYGQLAPGRTTTEPRRERLAASDRRRDLRGGPPEVWGKDSSARSRSRRGFSSRPPSFAEWSARTNARPAGSSTSTPTPAIRICSRWGARTSQSRSASAVTPSSV